MFFKKFFDAGIYTIPLKNGIPQVEWSRYFNVAPDASDCEKWDSAKHNEYALLCGGVSNVVAVDIDTDDLAERIYSFAGSTPVRKRGSKGFTAFYRYNGEKSQNWKTSAGEVICEILSTKRLTTIPPSPHRKTGKPYVWLDKELLGTDLPCINDDFILLMDAKYPKQKPFSISPPREVGSHDDIRLYEAERMLTFVDPSCSRDEWVQIGMALRDEYGDAACHVWHNWSAKSTKYNHNVAQSSWRSFTGGGVTIATLVYYAKRGGWMPEQEIDKPEKKKTKSESKPQKVNVGGLVGDVANWITSTAIRPQPELSLAAALSVVSAIKGHRVQSSMREARTNLLILSLAPTGGGKDHPQYAAQKLLKACGLDRIIMGRPTSGTALLTGLNKTSCVGWLKIDEFGRYLANASGKQAQSHQREIVDYMIELYTCANRTFYGRQYANDKENPQIILEQPHFCCLGSTVEEKMREACRSGEVIDGFLNRWLVFNSHERPKKNLALKDYDPPQWLVDKILAWLSDFPLQQDSYGNAKPMRIELTPEAWEKFIAYEEKIEKLIETVGYPINELYARAGEHVIKIATTITDDLWVGTGEIDIAIAITDKSIAEIVKFASGIADNQHQQNVIFVRDIISRAGKEGITKNEITRRTQKINNKDRTDILNQLVEAGDISFEKDGKKVIFYS